MITTAQNIRVHPTSTVDTPRQQQKQTVTKKSSGQLYGFGARVIFGRKARDERPDSAGEEKILPDLRQRPFVSVNVILIVPA